MAEDTDGTRGDSEEVQVPPKLDLRKMGLMRETPGEASEPEDKAPARKQETARLVVEPEPEQKQPPDAAPAGTGAPPAGEGKPAGKRETSRIPLQTVAAAPGREQPLMKPKTIRLQPAAPLTARRPLQPLAVTKAPSSGEAAARAEGDKRKTSRIPLDQALSAAAKTAAGVQPKTIKIKAAGTPATVIAARAAEDKLEPREEAPGGGRRVSPGETARLDKLAETPTAAAPTQKKTIRVRRPAGGPGAGAATGVRVTVTPEEAAWAGDEPGWFFALIGLAAVLVVCVVIYVLAAQAVGPNTSLTQLSYSVNGPDLTWPGKLRPAQ